MMPGAPEQNYLAGHARAAVDPAADFETVYADDSLLVLNKPAGLLSVPGRGEDKQDCLSSRVQQRYPDALIVHRLDMATSGLILMARGPAMQRTLSGLFEKRDIQKRYVAVVAGRMDAAQSQRPDADGWHLIDLPIAVDWENRPLRVIDKAHGKPSQTRWRVAGPDEHAQGCRLELEPVTGRSHQLRIHLKAVGHPIMGDQLYAPASVQAMAPRLLLHAARLTFRHPGNGRPMHLECEPGF
jgi:tRNA pseudouridine32 synthase/23S rRNA pseudouridine746 synthase